MCEKVLKNLYVVSEEWACGIYSRQEENKLFFIEVAVSETNNTVQHY